MDQEIIQVIFGLKVKALREKKKISLKALGEQSGLSPSYINEIEKGKKYPKPEKTVALADALDVTYDHLVSLEMDKEHIPLAHVLEAPLLRQFPFHLFGTSARELFHLMAEHPTKMSVLARMLAELGRNYDMRVEHFFYTALRCYQVMNNNYFEDVEKAVAGFRRQMRWSDDVNPSFQLLCSILQERYGYAFDEHGLKNTPELANLRTAVGSGPLMMLNPRLSEPQKAFAAARELGYKLLGATKRGTTSPTLEVGTFDEVYNDFRASYFASALLVPTLRLKLDLETLFKMPHWDGTAVLSLLNRYNTTPEMLFYRFSEVIPRFFRARRVHFMKFVKREGDERVRLDKQLNMSRVHIPNGIGLKEHFCRRWLSLGIIYDLEAGGGDAPIIGAQVSDFLDYTSEFFCIAIAYRSTLEPNLLSSVTIGFNVDNALKKTIKFHNDPVITRRRLGQTCERCPLTDCEVRAAEPRTYLKEQKNQERKDKLEELLSSRRN
ncbi:MAG: helix-turn-helix domain-containing protein [Acidobacteriota bacterium]|nr:helix-turn-helix domain-containing protein [Acidobacteriota bacterium]